MSESTTFDFGPVPSGWLWGAATAAHQIEGGNTNSDWWAFEHQEGSPAKESSGDACDSWHRWRDDLELVREMGLDSYRMSIEWARIEPAEAEFSLAALEHYRIILATAQEMGLKTSVTFHHFTTPQWMALQDGWMNAEIVDRFARYVDIAVQHLGDHIDLAATINEPNVVAGMGYQHGGFAPGIAAGDVGLRAATENFVGAHLKAREVLKAGPGDFPVGLTLALPDQVTHPDGTLDGPGFRWDELTPGTPEAERMRMWAGVYLEAAQDDDYVGVQTYTTEHLDAAGNLLPVPEETRVTQMGWRFEPEALGRSVRHAHAVAQVPVIVTEIGIATMNDDERIEYYSRSLTSLRQAMDDGVEVRGFYAWSLLDNFEWAEGYRPTFGLAAVDPVTFDRALKPSGRWLAEVAWSSRS
ncbi:glycoside hydrolase family 1 protein [Demequina zhanjiangensis]|uniref:Family 1 glycosylhydrolase n=1 Tax=Demequina zhanjiangensis TaxID=3051659 RepID=A0ABT8FZ96_9MICO|nr:family 1 glycosylhydrolase [Demequina sp. SYSU T00b26]MDN4472172.1 family 1 glycosylhydrolase [Demequina sp. SYSU T00b26]